MKKAIIFILTGFFIFPLISQSADEQRLRSLMESGCLTNGSLKRRISTGEVFYRKQSVQQPSKQVDFYANMTYRFTDGSKSGKWRCDELSQNSSNSSSRSSNKSSSKTHTNHKCNWCGKDIQGNGFSISGGEIRIGKYYDPIMAKMMFGATENVGDYCSRKCAFDSQ